MMEATPAPKHYLESATKQFEHYKLLGEKTFAQMPDERLFWQYNEDSNSIATIVKHLWGNTLGRWTDFMTADGEKEWRNRDAESENYFATKQEMMEKWDEGWRIFLDTLKSLKSGDLAQTVCIRNQGHTVPEAVSRQLAHYPYHIGQIVYTGKMCAEKRDSLSIPKGNPQQYNAAKFSGPKEKGRFTGGFPPHKNNAT